MAPANALPVFTESDTGGEPLSPVLSSGTKQLNERRLPGLGVRFAIEPAHQTNNIDGGSGGHML